MIIEEDVKALSEILRATKVEFYTEKREVCLAQLLNISDSLNLARVALEFCEARQAVRKESERRKKSWIPK